MKSPKANSKEQMSMIDEEIHFQKKMMAKLINETKVQSILLSERFP